MELLQKEQKKSSKKGVEHADFVTRLFQFVETPTLFCLFFCYAEAALW
jgi:hypothetical protein